MKIAPYKPGQSLKEHVPTKRVTETEVETYLIGKVKAAGGIAKKWYARGNAGVHDRIILFPEDEIWLVEVKAPDGKKSPKQKSFHKELYDMDYTRSVTVWCKEDVDVWLELRNICLASGTTLDHWSYQPEGLDLMLERIKR